MDQWETLAEIVRLQRRQAAHLDRMSDQLDKLERLVGADVDEQIWQLPDEEMCPEGNGLKVQCDGCKLDNAPTKKGA